jgi:hypothetical protein
MMRSPPSILHLVLLIAACRLPAGEAPAAPPAAVAAAPEVIGFGDVHGDPATFRALLASLGLIDREGRWSGGSRRLVQVGDLVDRGTDSRGALEIAMRLEAEAAAAGGAAIFLLGNHEVMAMTGDIRYARNEDLASFLKEEVLAERDRRKRRILGLLRSGSPLFRSGFYKELSLSITEETFDSFFPPGAFARLAAFSPSGKYGKWLLARPVACREAGTVFVHGGLDRKYGLRPLGELDREVRQAYLAYVSAVGALEKLEVFDGVLGPNLLETLIADETAAGGPNLALAETFRKLEEVFRGILFDPDGPLWHRDLALEDERIVGPALTEVLAFQGARRIAIGHTISPRDSILSRLGGRVILLDTGMNAEVYGGIPSALLLKPDGAVRAWALPAGRAR